MSQKYKKSVIYRILLKGCHTDYKVAVHKLILGYELFIEELNKDAKQKFNILHCIFTRYITFTKMKNANFKFNIFIDKKLEKY